MSATCPNCGKECEAEARFCSSCGTMLQPGSEDLEAFIRDFRKRLEKDPEDADARFNLALAYKHARSLDLAREELERLRARQPDSLDILFELAKLYRRLRRFADVKATAEAILALDPNHEAAARMLRRVKEQTGER